jgi:hypothetical protein
MPVSSAPSLLLGLSARIFIDRFILLNEPSMRDVGLLGLWQGVAVYYASTISQELALAVTFLIGAKVLLDFSTEQDITKCATTVIGAVLGVFGTDVLSRFLGDGLYGKQPSKTQSHTAQDKKKRTVHFHRNTTGDGNEHRPRRTSRLSPSDITSIDTSSDLIRPQPSMSPQDREVARLRARASLADTERRRYKEERKWALSQGNHARASQMTWEVKRYKALMQSFHKEADALVIQGEGGCILYDNFSVNMFAYLS